MTWLVWRQHRTQAGSGAALIAVLAVFLFWTHGTMTDYLRSSGLSDCLAAGGDCDLLRMQFRDRFETLNSSVGWFNLFPLLVGMFWGAPLIARELEQGTHRLAWTQSVTRRRWFLSRLAFLVATATLATVVFSRMVVWWFQEFGRADRQGVSRMTDEVYNFSALVPVGYTLYALALAVVAGAVVRRTLPAMAVTLALWLPVRLWAESMRFEIIEPLKVAYAPFTDSPRAGLGDWVRESRMVGPDGVPLGFVRPGAGPCAGVGQDKEGLGRCLEAQGYQQVDVYQPASRFWELQSLEFALFGGLALVLLVVAYLWVTRRVAP